jgi:hypothetical protein
MPRLSPITLGLSVLMIAILTTAAILMVGARHTRERASVEGETAEAPPGAAAPTPAPEVTVAPPPPPPPAPPPLPAAAPAQPAPVMAVATAPDPDAQAPGEDAQLAAAPPNRRALLTVNHNRRRQQADENVFNSLGLPEETRAAIRRINEEYRRQTEPTTPAAPASPPPVEVGEAAAALKAREAAITQLLGPDQAKEFDSQERAAVLRLRGKYRFEWGRQLRE